jgi:hypothetical protein
VRLLAYVIGSVNQELLLQNVMQATSSELLIRNFNESFIELDPVKRAALLAASYTDDCLCGGARLSQFGEYVYGPACETDVQLAVIGIQDMAEVAYGVDPAIERSLGVENFSPGAGVDAAPCTTTPARWTPCTGAWVGITRHFYE